MRSLRRILAALAIPAGAGALLMQEGYAFRQPAGGALPEPHSAWPAPGAGSKPMRGLVLSGGLARGYAHVGVIHFLDEAGIKPDVIVGSIVGAVYSSGVDGEALARHAREADWSLLQTPALPRLGFLRGDRVRAFVNQRTGHRPIEAFPIRFGAVATNFQTGELKLFNRGDPGLAAQASASVPGVFEPVAIGERLFVDGGLVSPLPIRCARKIGATLVALNRIRVVDSGEAG